MSAVSLPQIADSLSSNASVSKTTLEFILKLARCCPSSITGKNLAGCEFFKNAAHPFASVCFHFSQANIVLRPLGWQVVRGGGKPENTYCLRPIR